MVAAIRRRAFKFNIFCLAFAPRDGNVLGAQSCVVQLHYYHIRPSRLCLYRLRSQCQ